MYHVNEFLKNNESFWGGKLSDEIEKLNQLVPMMGEVPNKKDNPALEDWRKLSNAYYRFYNDGALFGKKLRHMFKRYGMEYDGICTNGNCYQLEELANRVYKAAIKEQDIS